MSIHKHRYKSARNALKFNILFILLAVRFMTLWHPHRIMTHFWPSAVGVYLVHRCHMEKF